MKQSERFLKLFLPFEPEGVSNYLEKEFHGKEARSRWAKIFAFIGSLAVISITIDINALNATDLINLAIMILVPTMFLLAFVLINHDKKMLLNRRLAVLLGIYAVFLWFYGIIKHGLSAIYPNLIMDELLTVGALLFILNKPMRYLGIIMIAATFLFELFHLVI